MSDLFFRFSKYGFPDFEMRWPGSFALNLRSWVDTDLPTCGYVLLPFFLVRLGAIMYLLCYYVLYKLSMMFEK